MLSNLFVKYGITLESRMQASAKGEVPDAVHDITFYSHQQDQPGNPQEGNTAGPAQTLNARFHAISSGSSH